LKLAKEKNADSPELIAEIEERLERFEKADG
jgi:hypothetical protein